jgi:pyridinium-3,5-bisthiocarboxylic acid mononucleotide nickel chelatase
MKILYFDCFNGAAGDMILGAFLDAGLPLDGLRDALGSLGIRNYEVTLERVRRAGVTATKFRLLEKTIAAEALETAAAANPSAGPTGFDHARGVHHSHPHPHAHHDHPHRTLSEIHRLIDQSALTAVGKDRAKALFDRLGAVEADVHGVPIERIHLHEVGALDSIIDIVGAVFAFEWARADRVIVSALNVGGGMVESAHGTFPVPAPATARLLGDAPVYSSGTRAELLTPTGALLLTAYASGYGPLPAMRVRQIGYGAGDRDFASTPNVLRLFVGESAESAQSDRVVVLACEIDDMNPQLFGSLMDRLYAAGALDVFYTPVQMKKNRPGTLVTILASPERRESLSAIVFRETTTIGIRYHEMMRERLNREVIAVDTPIGSVRFKVARDGTSIVNATPEFDDCERIARERELPIKEVQAAALKAWLDRS